MKRSIIIIISLFFFNQCFSQIKSNPFKMVNVDESVRNQLYKFIWKETKDSVKAGMYIHHLLGEDKSNNYKFVEGIYIFRLMGPHFPLYYFIYTKKDGVKILEDYSVESVFPKVLNYFKEHQITLNEEQKIAYIEAIVSGLKQRNEERK